MKLTRLEELQKSLPSGLYVYTYSPGDGITRYRFSQSASSCYFACRSIYTALGYKEAATFARGMAEGYYFAKEEE